MGGSGRWVWVGAEPGTVTIEAKVPWRAPYQAIRPNPAIGARIPKATALKGRMPAVTSATTLWAINADRNARATSAGAALVSQTTPAIVTCSSRLRPAATTKAAANAAEPNANNTSDQTTAISPAVPFGAIAAATCVQVNATVATTATRTVGTDHTSGSDGTLATPGAADDVAQCLVQSSGEVVIGELVHRS